MKVNWHQDWFEHEVDFFSIPGERDFCEEDSINVDDAVLLAWRIAEEEYIKARDKYMKALANIKVRFTEHERLEREKQCKKLEREKQLKREVKNKARREARLKNDRA